MPARFLAIFFLLSPAQAFAQALPALTSTPMASGGIQWSLSIQTLLLLTGITFLPALILMMTSFTRIIIVFSLLRHALGTQTSPPNQVLVGLALFLTFFIMAPVGRARFYTEAWLPLSENKHQLQRSHREALPCRCATSCSSRSATPDLATCSPGSPSNAHGSTRPTRSCRCSIVIPAFVTSELKTAFQIGFIVFIPFLIIDMVVASVLMSMGMMMMSPGHRLHCLSRSCCSCSSMAGPC
jgi:flagellar biosynthetic protein FliP